MTDNGTADDNIDPQEIAKFEQLAHRWWDPEGDFKPLHDINPLRLGYIMSKANLAGTAVLDVGCGGGILAESMANAGAVVTGTDMADGPLSVARLHAMESGVQVDYRRTTAEALAATSPGHYRVVTCLEMLEHVPNIRSVVQACATLCEPGGDVFFSTINRHPKAYALAVLGAEYVLGLLPRGTHDYQKFVTPAELSEAARRAGLTVQEIRGMSYNPFTRAAGLTSDVKVNYLLHATRDS